MTYFSTKTQGPPLAKLSCTGTEETQANRERMNTCRPMESDTKAEFMVLKLSRADDWVWM